MSSIIEISVAEFRTRQSSEEAIIFFDVREEWEHIEENIGAKCLPLGEIPKRLNEIAHLKNEEIILHCKTGKRAGQACKYLKSQGFTKVLNLSGGIEAYLEVSMAK